MGFIDILALEDFFRPAPFNIRQKKYIKKHYKKSIHNPEFFESVCNLSDKKCELYPDKMYQLQLKKMIYSEIAKTDHAFVN